jgi:hypothetical protein
MREEIDFPDSPLGYHAMRKKNNPNFIDSFNYFWMWQSDIETWSKMGRPNPFDDSDVAVFLCARNVLLIGLMSFVIKIL